MRYNNRAGRLAQLAEQLTLNQWVQGSSPWSVTNYFADSWVQVSPASASGAGESLVGHKLLCRQLGSGFTGKCIRCRRVPGRSQITLQTVGFRVHRQVHPVQASPWSVTILIKNNLGSGHLAKHPHREQKGEDYSTTRTTTIGESLVI